MECISIGLPKTGTGQASKRHSVRPRGFALRTFRERTRQNILLSSVLWFHQNGPWDKVGMPHRQTQASNARVDTKHTEAHVSHQHQQPAPILVGAYQRGILAAVLRGQKQPLKWLRQALELW